jgi:hypothetical protein
MSTFLITLAIVGLLYGVPASIRTFRNQLGDPRAALLFVVGAVIVACGLWR